MLKYTVQVSGMMCGMCEAHVNDLIRREMDIKKVSSSHKKNETVILAEHELDEKLIRDSITASGYEVGTITKEEKKKGLFGW